jgi:pimeloyl-ACP methyl ester carboxylesterase
MRASADEALHTLAKQIGMSDGELQSHLCVIGHSLGAAVALDFAAHHRVERVVAIAPFTSLREEAGRVAGTLLARLLIESYDNRASLAELLQRNPAARVAIFHGIDDNLIPVQMGRQLSETAPNRIDFFPVAHADHVTVLTVARAAIIDWMNR